MADNRAKRFRRPRHWTPEQVLAHHSLPQPNGCVLWGGGKSSGYGYISIEGGLKMRAHRFAWVLRHGEIPDGLRVCHRCDVPGCINVDHLFLGTDADNSSDKIAKGRLRTGTSLGEKHGCAKLTDAQVAEILRTTEAARIVAARYGVSRSAIALIREGKTWKHVHAAKTVAS